MESTDFQLREAEESELDGLIDRAEKYLPHSLPVYNLMSVGFRRKFIDKDYTKLYIPANGTNQLFIIITGIARKRNRQNLMAFWDPKDIPTDVAEKLLLSLPNSNWEETFQFKSSPLTTLNQIEKIILGDEGLGKNKLDLLRREGYAYKLSDERKLHSNFADEDFAQDFLSEKDADIVYNNWIYYYNDTLEGVQSYMKHLPAIAAFAKVPMSEATSAISNESIKATSQVELKPASWAICRHSGEIGFTFTLPGYRNKGLSSAVACALAKELLKIGISPFVNICGNNPAAVKAHENIGFKKYCPIGYHLYIPKGMSWEDY